MKLKMTPNTVSNFLFAQLCRTTVGEGGVLIHKFGEVLNYLKMSGAHFNGLLNVIFVSKNFILASCIVSSY